jgi:hypothetical protein
LAEYFIDALAKVVSSKKWEKCLKEGRKQVVEFYPPQDPPWVETEKSRELEKKGNDGSPPKT